VNAGLHRQATELPILNDFGFNYNFFIRETRSRVAQAVPDYGVSNDITRQAQPDLLEYALTFLFVAGSSWKLRFG